MVDALPYASFDNPWEGDGPSMGYGGSDSTPEYGGASEMVNTSVSLQYLYALVPPRPHTYIDMAGMAEYPDDNRYSDVAYTTLAKLPTVGSTGDYQDYITPVSSGDDYSPDIALQAPAIPLGGATAAQRSA